MKDEIDSAIKSLTAKSIKANTSDDAMKFSQAVSNLAHARATINHDDRETKRN